MNTDSDATTAKPKRPNKQVTTRAASFKRIAKDVRALLKGEGVPRSALAHRVVSGIAKAFDKEATELRSHR